MMENVRDKQAEAAPPKKFVVRNYRAETYMGEMRFPEVFGRG